MKETVVFGEKNNDEKIRRMKENVEENVEQQIIRGGSIFCIFLRF